MEVSEDRLRWSEPCRAASEGVFFPAEGVRPSIEENHQRPSAAYNAIQHREPHRWIRTCRLYPAQTGLRGFRKVEDVVLSEDTYGRHAERLDLSEDDREIGIGG